MFGFCRALRELGGGCLEILRRVLWDTGDTLRFLEVVWGTGVALRMLVVQWGFSGGLEVSESSVGFWCVWVKWGSWGGLWSSRGLGCCGERRW